MLKLSQEQQLPDLELASIVRAHGFITLGKLCLQNEDVVKNCLLQMNQELEVTENEAIRNNIVLVFCDLIVRYAIFGRSTLNYMHSLHTTPRL